MTAPDPEDLPGMVRPRVERWLADAEVIGSGDSPDLCRTQATLRLEPARVAELLDAPLGNHLVLVPGHHAERLERWWRLVIAKR